MDLISNTLLKPSSKMFPFQVVNGRHQVVGFRSNGHHQVVGFPAIAPVSPGVDSFTQALTTHCGQFVSSLSCDFGASCRNQKQCMYKHPSITPCKYGNTCKNSDNKHRYKFMHNKCGSCGDPRHTSATCPQPQSRQRCNAPGCTENHSDHVCRKCGMNNHMTRNCRN